MRNSIRLLHCCTLIFAACSGVTPVPVPTASPAPTALVGAVTPEPVVTHPELEIITPANVAEIEQVARWGEGKIYDVAVSPDEMTIAVSTVAGVHLYDTFTLDETQFIERSIYNTVDVELPVAFSPDGEYLAFAGSSGVTIRKLATGETKRYVSAIPDWPVSRISVSPNNKHMILTTQRADAYCDRGARNVALYDIAETFGHLIIDNYVCGQDVLGYLFGHDNKAYLWYSEVGAGRYRVDVVDLTVNALISSRVFYDVTRTPPGVPTPIPTKAAPVSPCAGIPDRFGFNTKIISSGHLSTIVASDFEGTITVESWDNSLCERIGNLSFGAASQAVLSHDGAWLATLESPHDLVVWDVATGRIRFNFAAPPLTGFEGAPAFNPRGTLLIVGTIAPEAARWPSRGDNQSALTIWETRSGRQVGTIALGSKQFRHQIDWLYDSTVAVSDPYDVEFWDIKSGSPITTVTPLGSPFALTPNGKTVWRASGSWVSLYDIEAGQFIRVFRLFETPRYEVRGLYPSRDGARLMLDVGSYDGKAAYISTIDTESGFEFYRSAVGFYDTATSNGVRIATFGSDGRIQLWSFRNASPEQVIYGSHTLERASDPTDDHDGTTVIRQVAFSPQGQLLISLDSENRVRFWEIATGKLLGEINPNFKIPFSEDAISISPDGRLIVVTATDGMLRVWGVKASPQ